MTTQEQDSLWAEYYRLGDLLVKRDTTIKRLKAQVKKLKAELNDCHVKLIHM